MIVGYQWALIACWLAGGILPPLVFSNSWCSLGWLGQRFLDAGASTFLGTAIPVFSRPARQDRYVFTL